MICLVLTAAGMTRKDPTTADQYFTAESIP
jgi:hypothetical protein